MRINNLTTGLSMPRDPVEQFRQADPQFIESSDSIARALDDNRRQRAEFLDVILQGGLLESFDRNFLDFYSQDRAIVFFISDTAAKRGLSLIHPRDVQ